MNITELLDTIRGERADWDGLLASANEERMLRPGVNGDWSIKDMIAHMTWFEREMVQMLEKHVLDASELWNLPSEQRNAAIFAENRDRTLEDVLSESQEVHHDLVNSIQALDEEDLIDPARFAGMPPDWEPLRIIADNTYEHYQAHFQDLQKWIAGK